MFENKKSVFSIIDNKTVIPNDGHRLYLSHGKVGLESLKDNRHTFLIIGITPYAPKVGKPNEASLELVEVLTTNEYTIPTDEANIDIINAKSAFSRESSTFSKLYTSENKSKEVLAFMESLKGKASSLNNFWEFITENAMGLPEVLDGIAVLNYSPKASCSLF